MKRHSLILAAILIISLTSCSNPYKSAPNPCESGHTWEDATCTEPKMCSVCGETEGKALGHMWDNPPCSGLKTCSVCGQTAISMDENHDYTELGVCKLCGATKAYENSYGYFSKSDLFTMAKDAIKDYAYPSYVHNFCLESDIYIEKVEDARLLYGSDSFSVVAYADFVINSVIYEDKPFVVVVEPHTSSKYSRKDAYIG